MGRWGHRVGVAALWGDGVIGWGSRCYGAMRAVTPRCSAPPAQPAVLLRVAALLALLAAAVAAFAALGDRRSRTERLGLITKLGSK